MKGEWGVGGEASFSKYDDKSKRYNTATYGKPDGLLFVSINGWTLVRKYDGVIDRFREREREKEREREGESGGVRKIGRKRNKRQTAALVARAGPACTLF